MLKAQKGARASPGCAPGWPPGSRGTLGRMLCPHCRGRLRAAIEETPIGAVELDYCLSCRGVWFDRGELEMLLLNARPDVQLLTETHRGENERPKECPHHRLPMLKRSLATSRLRSGLYGQATPLKDGVILDQCPACLGLWFDGGELGQVSEALRNQNIHPLLQTSLPPPQADRPASSWLWAFMFLTGLPVEENHPRRKFPIVVAVLLGLCVLCFLLELVAPNPQAFLQTHGLVPSRAFSGSLLPWLSHLFLHGGPWHLIGNLYFLWVFGDNVEDRLGPGRFVLLYLASGLAAAALQVALQRQVDLPLVGASGAISGVMAAYAVLFPHARLTSLIFVFQVQWKTTTYLLIWLAWQFLGAASSASNTAWWAHIGGFVAGGLIARAWRTAHRKEIEVKLLPPQSPAPPKLTWY